MECVFVFVTFALMMLITTEGKSFSGRANGQCCKKKKKNLKIRQLNILLEETIVGGDPVEVGSTSYRVASSNKSDILLRGVVAISINASSGILLSPLPTASQKKITLYLVLLLRLFPPIFLTHTREDVARSHSLPRVNPLRPTESIDGGGKSLPYPRNFPTRMRSYDSLQDRHLREYFGTHPTVRSGLVDLGFVTRGMTIVEHADQRLRIVDRALSELAAEDAAATREAHVAARGAAMAKLVEDKELERQAKRARVAAQYEKERKIRDEVLQEKRSPRARSAAAARY